MTTYERLVKLAKNRGTTITAVIKELRLSTSLPTAWKNGIYPSAENTIKLAEYFGVTCDYILRGEEKTVSVSYNNSPIIEHNTNSNIAMGEATVNVNNYGFASKKVQQLVNDYVSLSEGEQGKVDRFVRDLKENFPTYAIEKLTKYQIDYSKIILESRYFWELSDMLLLANEAEIADLLVELVKKLRVRNVYLEKYPLHGNNNGEN